MPRKTNSELIILLIQRTRAIRSELDERTKQFQQADERQQADVKSLKQAVEALQQKNAAFEERCAGLQRQADRTWQVWLALIVAAVGLIVSFVKR